MQLISEQKWHHKRLLRLKREFNNLTSDIAHCHEREKLNQLNQERDVVKNLIAQEQKWLKSHLAPRNGRV